MVSGSGSHGGGNSEAKEEEKEEEKEENDRLITLNIQYNNSIST